MISSLDGEVRELDGPWLRMLTDNRWGDITDACANLGWTNPWEELLKEVNLGGVFRFKAMSIRYTYGGS